MQQDELSDAITKAHSAYEVYTQAATAAFRQKGAYEAEQNINTGWDNDVYDAIQSLPRDIAGLTPTAKQMAKWSMALAVDARGADLIVASGTMVVQMAKDTHAALQTASQVAGGAALVMTGVQLATQQGCTEFVKWTIRTGLNIGASMAIGRYGVSAVKSLCEKFGIAINPEYLQIAADGAQCFSAIKAARAQRKAAAAQCFTAGTEVLTGSSAQPGVFSEKKIEDIAAGDWVWSKDQNDPDAPLQLRKVVQTFAHKALDLQTVSITDGAGNIENIHVTDEHPFYVDGKGWTGSAHLNIGDRMQSPDGHTMTVTGNVDDKPIGGATVYNFEVEGSHTYFVADGVGADRFTWVHNVCGENGEYIGMYKAKPWDFPGIKAKTVTFTKRDRDIAAGLRATYKNSVRSAYLKNLVATKEGQLRKILKDADIKAMRAGTNPKGYEVHHKTPLDFEGGTNDYGNLILLGKSPYHAAVTNESKVSVGADDRARFTFDWPDFGDRFIYNGK